MTQCDGDDDIEEKKKVCYEYKTINIISSDIHDFRITG